MAIAMTTGYSAQTEGALLCIEAASDWALTCVDQLAAADSYVLIDYGAADGGTAVGLWHQVLDRLHANQPQAHLTLIGNDLPSNDNVALAENLALQIARAPKPTVLVSARSFYEPSVGPNTVSFGFSATAMHWLSESPGALNTHTHVLASGDADALQRFTAQALKDWTDVLELRSKELKVGGRLLTVNLSRDEEGRYLGHNGGETRNVHDQLHQIWKSLADEGVISEEQYRKGTVLNFYKSPDEFMAPLKDQSSAPYRNGLRLVDERTVYVKCPYRRRWEENSDTAAFAAGLMATIRSWSRHSFASAAGDAAADEVYRRLEQRIAEAPSEWSLDYVEHHQMMEKVA
ncbi:SAM dependent carboxyl methyltransferase [Synechococcus sp. MIT S9509]|uniref:SAM-dependent methyltransferase n=1 Tax=Synechococcus sp. MIT S9509 TaxID=1801630 RepID=UPI0007BC6274|nr:SAM-dependent methyltransferase [Synechococcus sp. MIT S9509]KZR93699.1 SAM dependent carboxyl methyltransferase [Synechococcus sp. MIT S9509]